MNKDISELVDIMFNFDFEELEKETDFLKEYKKIKEENKKYKTVLDKIKEYIKEDKNCVPKHISDYILELLEELKNE